MKSRFGRAWTMVALCVMAGGLLPVSLSHGQSDPRPISNIGGYARAELGNIYRSDIGQGFSVASLNSIALQNARAQVGYVGQVNTRPGGGGPVGSGFGVGSGGTTLGKPFAGFSPSPTTSPYLNLFREDFEGSSDLNYNTLVRPQLQQQQFNQQVQRQNVEIARRMQSMAAQNDFGQPQGDKNQFPTGHQTVFRYFGHFHPSAPYRPVKQQP